MGRLASLVSVSATGAGGLMTVYSQESGDGHSWTLSPNRSLDWRQTKRIFWGFAGLMALFGAYWIAQGAWLVLPFFGLELAVLGLGLYLSALSGGRREVVRIEGPDLVVQRGGRRLEREDRLPRYWSRVVLSRDPSGWYPSRLSLLCYGRRVPIACGLAEGERLALAEALTQGLGPGPAAFHRRCEPATTGVAVQPTAPQVNREGTWP